MKPNKKNILLVDDEEQIINVVRAYLEKEGYNVFTAYNGKEALDVFNKESIDFIVLDLMLPDLPGEEVCKKIRLKSEVPILMLTAKVSEGDRINGLDIGADDYMIKPFSPKELVARVRAILRRTCKDFVKADIIEFNNGDLIIDINKMEVKKRGELIKLTPKEFKLLIVLAKNLGKVFTREELVDKVLGYDYDGYDRTIDAHIKNLRHKIEDEENKYIVTVYGVGYKFLED
ncbi:transcriptional regulator [Caloranaerobacter azorensis H53214]|uniref:Transcriptional regulator n=1 Tax=Caloranaerobacter azorensis H53214 TaxID=1156417 RepID=A0A096CV43_9FIRM|nr:response regulator transcription factor [Caloranaerobacter azorensis]KGG80419.1 transcriptional regulator [Caloranaerobacter azorensis H53214]